MADLSTSGTSMGNLRFEASLPRRGRGLPDLKAQQVIAVVAAEAQTLEEALHRVQQRQVQRQVQSQQQVQQQRIY